VLRDRQTPAVDFPNQMRLGRGKSLHGLVNGIQVIDELVVGELPGGCVSAFLCDVFEVGQRIREHPLIVPPNLQEHQLYSSIKGNSLRVCEGEEIEWRCG
jgi:hypothetical protein